MRSMLKKVEAVLARPSHGVKNALEPARKPIRWVTWTFVVIVVILIVWDIILQRWDPTRPNTWSEVAREASYALPILPWFLGAMVGHLFHGGRIPRIDRDAGATLMGFFTFLVIVWSVFLYLTYGVVPALVVAGMARAGVVVAYVIWPLDRLGDWHW